MFIINFTKYIVFTEIKKENREKMKKIFFQKYVWKLLI